MPPNAIFFMSLSACIVPSRYILQKRSSNDKVADAPSSFVVKNGNLSIAAFDLGSLKRVVECHNSFYHHRTLAVSWLRLQYTRHHCVAPSYHTAFGVTRHEHPRLQSAESTRCHELDIGGYLNLPSVTVSVNLTQSLFSRSTRSK